jgi:hypothetical protein
VNEVFRRLERFHGISERTASARLHALKFEAGLPGDAELEFDLTGSVYVLDSREHLGSLTQGGGP